MTHRIYGMSFVSVYGALVAKAERKGRSLQEVDDLTSWLTGYTLDQLAELRKSDLTYGDFFRQAPAYAEERLNITGKICGVQIEAIEDPIMQEIRRLDKLIDWLAKGKTVSEIVTKYS